MIASVLPARVDARPLYPRFNLTVSDRKVVSVALASIAFFSLQCGLVWPVVLTASFCMTAITYYSEKYIRMDQSGNHDWFSIDLNWRTLSFWSSLVVLRPLILRILCGVLGIPFPGLPQVGLARAICTKPWTMIPLAVGIAPIAEEILFRGFLLERLEDIMALFKRHTFIRISDDVSKKISNGLQAVIFGILHLNGSIEEASRSSLRISLSLFGYLAGHFKRSANSLIGPVAMHSANNLGAVIQIFLGTDRE